MNMHVLVEEMLCHLVLIFCLFLFFNSLHSFGLPPSRDREHVSTSPALQQDFGQGGQTATTELSTSSLGLLQLLQERGISASRHPHHNLHYSRTGKPSFSTVSDKRGDFFSHKEGRRNIFSWNLVEKLQSLGLHRVAAWGMRGPSDKDREAVRPPPKV